MMADLHLCGARRPRAAEELLERFELVEAADKPAETYSGGMSRRLDLAMTLVGNPRVIFLDEPTTGLDPRSRRTMWEIIRELVDDGATVLLTTQYLEEADQLADRIAVLDNGRIVAEGTAAELKRLIPGGHIRSISPISPTWSPPSAHSGRRRGGRGHRRPDPRRAERRRRAFPALRARPARCENIEAGGISVHTPNLDDVFLTLTGMSGQRPEAEAERDHAGRPSMPNVNSRATIEQESLR